MIVTRTLLLIAALTVATNAVADRNGSRLSFSVLQSDVEDVDGTERFSGDDTGWTIGYSFRFNDHFALGAAGGTLGKPKDTVAGEFTEIEVDIFDLYIEGIMPLNESVEVFGRFGRSFYNTEINGRDTDLFGEDASLVGAGLMISLNDSFQLRGEGTFYNGPSDEEATSFGLGIVFTF